MNSATQRSTIAGAAGLIEIAIDSPLAPRGVAVLCHPHPQHGGTLDNKVVQTLARAFVQLGYRAVRFNFRGVGASQGEWDEGRGEIDDALAVVQSQRDAALPLVLGGFSFGGYVASVAAQRAPPVQRTVLIAPAVANFPVAPVSQDSIVVHGEADDVVPLSAVFDWARPQSLPVTVIPGAGHFFHGQLSLLKNLIVGAWR
jgi:alpha/beta superfamily hydrolase